MSTSSLPIAARLRQARIRAGLTLDQVAERLGESGHPLTKAAVSKYELGKSIPPATTLRVLGRVLGVRSAWFLEEPPVQVRWVAFRKQAALSQGRQEQVRVQAAEIASSQVQLERTLDPSSTHAFPLGLKTRRLVDAERAAERVRKSWKLDDVVIESVVRTIEDQGGVVVMADVPIARFDGLSGWADDTFPILVSVRETSLDRRRYNFAHELGHLVMDCGNASELEQERLAHRFAAAFLVPAAVARRELGDRRRSISMQELGLLKMKYGLSMQAWARRAFDLEIISEGTYRRLCIEFSRRGWRKQEPVEFAGNEEPMRLRLLTLRALSEGMITPSRAEELCPGCTTGTLPASEVRELPESERDRRMRQAAAVLASDYQPGGALREFEAFGDADFIA